jgi:potassium-dependent mechanosensitive channel
MLRRTLALAAIAAVFAIPRADAEQMPSAGWAPIVAQAPQAQDPAAGQAPAAQAPAAHPVTTPAATTPAATPQAPAPAQQPAAATPQPTQQPQPAAAATPPAPPPPPALPPEVSSTITNVVGQMDGAEKTLSTLSNVNTDLGRLRDNIDDVISRTTQTADGLRPRLSDLQTQLKRLGSPPAKDAPPEAAAVTAERTRLDAQSAEVSGAIKTLEVTWWRARQAIDKITDLRLQMFVRSLTEQMASPIFPEFWSDLQRQKSSVEWRLRYNAEDWWAAFNRQKMSTLGVLMMSVVLYIALKTILLAVTRYRPAPNATPPSFFERAASASWIAPVRAIPGIAAAFLLYGGLEYLGLLYYPTAAPVGAALLRSILVFVAVSALILTVFAPRRPERRLMLLSDRSARRISRLLIVLALIYSADLFLSRFGQILYFPLSLSVAQSLFTSVAFALVLMGLLLTPFESSEMNLAGPVRRSEPIWLKFPLWIAALAIIGLCLTGYIALGRFLAQQLVMTGIVGLVATLLYLAIRAFTRGSTTSRGHISVLLEEKMGFDEVRRKQLGWLTEAVLTLCVAFVAIPVLLLQWGFAAPDIRDWLNRLLFGFEIGQIRISIVKILLGVLIFVALVFVTRLIQRRVRDNLLIAPRMDPGIANSIDTAIGYTGTGLAAVIAISYAGFNITNLAIVAGALSVGIGFGLQSIVNNFVSGLILLIERPIKVGDWVVVGSEQGTVRRISVRSTEIETFDRASLIVPNSELITGRVLNWTHRSALGRVVLKFTAGPDIDPRRVLTILTDCANRHPNVLREPAPLAVFEGYTPTTTEYSLRVLLPDITHGTGVQSDLRVAVYEALRRSGIVGSEAFPAAAPAAS